MKLNTLVTEQDKENLNKSIQHIVELNARLHSSDLPKVFKLQQAADEAFYRLSTLLELITRSEDIYY